MSARETVEFYPYLRSGFCQQNRLGQKRRGKGGIAGLGAGERTHAETRREREIRERDGKDQRGLKDQEFEISGRLQGAMRIAGLWPHPRLVFFSFFLRALRVSA
jgi:hypothetical protein